MRSASAIKPQSAAQQAAHAKPGALKAAPAKAAVTVLPPKLRRAVAHGSARAQAVSGASHDPAELMQASHSAVKETPTNHTQAGPVPPPRRAAASDEAIAVPAALRAPLVAIVGPRAVDSARLHIGPHASARAGQSQARALAKGDDIFFGAGQYRPGTREGDALIAHEIAHVDQAQRGLLHGPARKAMSGEAQGPLEAAADQAADQLTAGANLDEQQKARREAGKKPALVLVSPASAEAGLDGATPKAAPAQAAGQGKGKPGDAVEGEAGQGAPKPALAMAPGEAAAPIVSKAKLPPDLPLMPEPAVSLSPAEASRAGGVQARAKASATATASAPLATDNVAAAKAAVQVPQSENDARAAEKIVADLAASVKPSPEIVALCDRIKKLIREKRPADEDGVIDTRPQEVAQVAGATVEGDVQKNVDDTKSSYGPMSATPAGAPSVAPPDVAPLPGAAPAPELKAAAATPDAVPPAQVNLDDDAKRMEAKAVDAGLDGDAAQLVDGGPVGDARDARGEMKTLSKKGPAEALAEQKSALAKSDEDMAALQARAIASLLAARAGHATGVKAQQGDFKGGEEALRADLSKRAELAFTAAQTKVQDLLKDVPATAMKKWTTGLPFVSKQFNDDLRLVKDKIEDRHSGVGGFFVAGWDAVTGLPGWAERAYDEAEKNFGDGVCTLITDISIYVNGIIKIADDIIATARADIADIFSKDLPDGLNTWAAEQEKGFGKKLDGLHAQAEETRNSFNKELIDNAGGAVQSARENIQKLRIEAGGLWGRFLDAVGKFLDDPVRFIINGLLSLVGISPPAFWGVIAKVQQVVGDIVAAPMRFANNLLGAVAKGFSQFFDNIGRHLIEGFLEWLISGMKKDGIAIEIPKELSIRSVIGFMLQLMGISWARIRKLLVEQLGEKAVGIIEKTAGVIYTLATKGIAGVYEDVKKMLEPKTIIDAIIDAAVKYLAETLIVKVAARIVAMLNPAGAILAAVEAIYRVLKWIFTNAARIFHLIEAVVNGMADVIAGNLAGAANMVEKGLAMLVAPVIDFLADYIGLGGLPGKVAEAVKGMQAWVEGVMRNVITWLVTMGKKMLAALGFKGKDDKKDGKDAGGEIGQTLTFTEGDETHHLYIKVAGSSATVMVSSTPMTLTEWLDDLERKKVPALPDKAKQRAASALIATARKQLAATDVDADKAAQAKQSTDPNAPKPDALEPKIDAEAEALRNTLDQLGNMFGKPMLVKSLNIKGAAKVTAYTDTLVASIEEATSGTNIHSQATGPEFVKSLLDQRKAEASFDEASGVLTLHAPSAGALGAASAVMELGDAAAAGSGVARVNFTKGQADFTLQGAIDEVRSTLASGEAPPFKPVSQSVLGGDVINVQAGTGNLAIVDQEGVRVAARLVTSADVVFSTARIKAGSDLLNKTQAAFFKVGAPMEKIVAKGWLASGDRKAIGDGLPGVVAAVAEFGGGLDIRTLKRATEIEKTQLDAVVFNMSVPPAVIGNAAYRKNFEAEVTRQLGLQEAGQNQLTVDAWVVNVSAYKAPNQAWISSLGSATRLAVLQEVLSRIDEAAAVAQRETAELRQAQVTAAKLRTELTAGKLTADKALARITADSYIKNQFTGRFGNEVEWRAEHSEAIDALLLKLVPLWAGLESRSAGFVKNAITHNADQVGGGEGMLPDIAKVPRPQAGEDPKAWNDYLDRLEQYIGASKVNSRIGPGWSANVDSIFKTVTTRHKKEASYPLWLMNFKLDVNYT